MCQKPPEDYIEKIFNFILQVRSKVSSQQIKSSAKYACDVTAVWLDTLTHLTIEERGAREISFRTTGHDKLSVTAMLCAKADGTKLKPYTFSYLGNNPFLI